MVGTSAHGGGLVEFRILGPVEVWHDHRKVDLGRAELPKVRCLLAVLLRNPGVLVTTEALTDRVWGDEQPGPAVRYKYVGWLRAELARYGVALIHRDQGYILQVEPDQVDLHRFRRLVTAARRRVGAGEDRAASHLLREALELWRGTALTGVPGSWAELFRSQLNAERRDATVLRLRIDLQHGRHAELLDELTELATEHPVDEPIAELLMLALYRSGQQAQALATYERLAVRIRAAIGAEPGADLQSLHRRVQARDQTLLTEPVLRRAPEPVLGLQNPVPAEQPKAAIDGDSGQNPTWPIVPRQLPPAARHFAGRVDELSALSNLLEQAVESEAGALAISTITGSAGIGKTALAVYWAHQVAARFPDGQLYVNLRGFDPSGSPAQPAEVIRSFLDAFAVPGPHRPVDAEAQAATYRSLLANRRVLLVLDNAHDPDQVRPLLPASARCMAVVTSRKQLSGLVATAGAQPLALGLLPAADARQMLTRRLGPERIATEPHVVDELIELCARLPLALAIVAARAATHPILTLADLAGQLRDSADRLDAMDLGDLAADVRGVFSWSYQRLPAEAARLFRFLAVHPGPDIAPPAAASLIGIAVVRVRPLLAELVEAHLIEEHHPGRFAFHDLLRAYATGLSHRHDTQVDRRAAIHRTLDHYLHTAHAANLLLDSSREPITVSPPEPGVTPEEPTNRRSALDWFAAEASVLISAVKCAAGEFDLHAWQLAWTMGTFFFYHGRWHDQITVQLQALAAAQRMGDLSTQAHAHRSLGRAYAQLGHGDDALAHLAQALDCYGELGNHNGHARTHLDLSWVHERRAGYNEALRHAQLALERYELAGNQAGQANALNAVGWYRTLLGDPQLALSDCQRSLELHQQVGHRSGEAETWDSLGYAHHCLGQHELAIACYERALRLHRELGDRYNEAYVLAHIGDTHRRAGDPGAARDAWQHALTILQVMDHPDADQVRRKLRELEVTDKLSGQ